MKTILPTTHESHCDNASAEILPGSRVMAYKNKEFRPATVVSRYGALQTRYSEDLQLGPYADLVDLMFDGMQRVSKSHFTSGVKALAMLCILCLPVFANTTQIRADVESEIEHIRIDREKALKPVREALLRNLATEAKQWQAAGKLELVLSAEGRKAELEPALTPPLGDSKPVFLDEHPIHGSKAEEQYKNAQAQIYRGFAGRFAKLDAAVKSIEQIQKQLTMQGKTNDALDAAESVATVQDMIADLRIDFSTDVIVYERWYRREQSPDFVKFSRNGSCKQTYGPGVSGESDYRYKLAGNVITMTRGPSRPAPLILTALNSRTFDGGWKLVSDSEYQKAKESK